MIETPYASSEVVALIDGMRSTCLNDFPSGPFLDKTVGLGDFTGACSGKEATVALFAKDRRARFFEAAWTPGANTIVQHPRATPIEDAPIVVKMRVWKGVDVDEASFEDAVVDDLGVVNDIFNVNRSGLQFHFELSDIQDLKDELKGNCSDIQAGVDPYQNVVLDPQILEVFYFQRWSDLGVTCDTNGDTVPDGQILINYYSRLDGTALAHELGHALGLIGDDVEHVHNLSGFTIADADNVMWPTWAYPNPMSSRDHFSLGQIYRMNAADNSWAVMKAAPVPTWAVKCQAKHDEEYDCPFLFQELDDLP